MNLCDPAQMRNALSTGRLPPHVFRSTLERVPSGERDAWFDQVTGVGEVPDDGPDLPPGGVPYLPCPVNTLLRAFDHADVGHRDVFVDIGSGCGRALALAHFATGAGAIGIEIQSALVRVSRQVAARLDASRMPVIEGDAAELTRYVMIGSVFFFYCPFGIDRVAKVLNGLEPIARVREIRICAVHTELPSRSWLHLESRPSAELAVHRSVR